MRKYQIPMILVLTALQTDCVTTMEPISDTDESQVRISIAVGDTVRVLTKYGDRPTFEVVNITDKSLIGEELEIHYRDMAFLEKQVGGGPTGGVLTAVVVVAGGAVILLTLGLSQIGPGFPSVP